MGAERRPATGRSGGSQSWSGHGVEDQAAAPHIHRERRSMSIRVVIAEDQAMVLGALAALLETEGDIEVVGQARNGKEALQLAISHRPDIILADIEMPEMTGLEMAAELKRERIRTGNQQVRVVILTTFARAGYLRRALAAGA